MSLVGFKAQNHPQQSARRGARADVDDRGTHPDEFAKIEARLGPFTVDVAAAAHNTKCERFYSIDENGLEQSWAGERVWCNPPYSDIRAWVTKAWNEWAACTEAPSRIVMLLPANRTEQGWWQELVEPRLRGGYPRFRVEFLPGRMRFVRPGVVVSPKGDRPPFGVCLLIWGDVPA